MVGEGKGLRDQPVDANPGETASGAAARTALSLRLARLDERRYVRKACRTAYRSAACRLREW